MIPTVDGGVIDTMVTFPTPPATSRYGFVQGSLGQHGGDPSKSPVAYLFGDSLALPEGADPVAHTIAAMDEWGIDRAVVDLGMDRTAERALEEHPDRCLAICSVDPNRGMDAVRELVAQKARHGIVGASLGPAFYNPQVPIDDRRMYPIYAKCVELDIPIFITVGVPGPRVPMAAQRVELLDEVCYFFPELRIVMRHGAEPWEDLAVKLMVKWPNLYYSTSAFSPRHYPSAIIDYANTRGAEKLIFGGYYAVGLSWKRTFEELRSVPLKDHVWPGFLRHNALRVLDPSGSLT